MKDKLYYTMIRNQKGASMVLGVFIIMMLLALAGLLIDGGRVILAYNQLFHTTYIAAEANLASYDRDLWKKQRVVKFDMPLAEELIKDVFEYNMEEAEIVNMTATSSNSMHIETKAEIPLIFIQWLNRDKATVCSETGTFIID